MTTPRRKTAEERNQDWRVVHTFDLGGSDVRKARILNRPPSKHFVFEIGMKGHIGDEFSWVPFEEDVFTERVVRRVNREIIQLLGRLALERLELTEHAMAIADTDELLASLVPGDAIEVQCGGSGSPWLKAQFVRVAAEGWVRVVPVDWPPYDEDDPDETLIMPGHVRRPA